MSLLEGSIFTGLMILLIVIEANSFCGLANTKRKKGRR